MMASTVLHRAAWLIPVSGPPVEDGAVLTEAGTIRKAGRYADLIRDLPPGCAVSDHGDAAILPGLVNAHTHAELGFLEGRIPLPQPSYTAWVTRLFELRAEADPATTLAAYRKGLEAMRASGTCLFGDITNGLVLNPEAGNGGGSEFPVRAAFLEFLRFDAPDLESAAGAELLERFDAARGCDPLLSAAVHACYSASAEITREAKSLTRKLGRPFSVHAAEHAEEMEFLLLGTGFCRELLKRLGRWNASWSPPGRSPVETLDALGVLDSGTLLVHAVHMRDRDWNLAAERGASVCFCPRSNVNLGAQPPHPVEAIRRGISAALGTDSLASNTDLDLFSEMAFLLDHAPGLAPESALRMATLNGARALGLEAAFGSIESGKRDTLLTVSLPAGTDRSNLASTVIERGQQGELQWIHAAKPN